MKDDLGDRMKSYEAVGAKRLLRGAAVCARIDGRGFSKFTRGFEKPYDPDLAMSMKDACIRLVESTHAKIGFVQSDEITLIWDDPEIYPMIFNGREQKLVSVLASQATSAFCTSLSWTHPDEVMLKKPHFDARVWTVPSHVEAANVLVWRSQDARKNGVSSAARAHMSAKKMHGLNQSQMIAAMAELGTDYDSAYPEHHRFGTYYQNKVEERTLSETERMKIPPVNRPPADMVFTRGEVKPLDIQYFGDVVNRNAVIFLGEDPVKTAYPHK